MEPAALSIGGFLAAYFLTLIIPGQNMFAIASCSALQGLRATLPLSLGIASGAACLCLAILAGMGSLVQIEHLPAVRILICMLVTLMAYRLFQLHICETPSGSEIFDDNSSLLVCGFLTAFFNPTTALFFVARSMPETGIQAPPLAAAGASVLTMMLMFSLFVSVFCSRPAIRLRIERRRRLFAAVSFAVVVSSALIATVPPIIGRTGCEFIHQAKPLALQADAAPVAFSPLPNSRATWPPAPRRR